MPIVKSCNANLEGIMLPYRVRSKHDVLLGWMVVAHLPLYWCLQRRDRKAMCYSNGYDSGCCCSADSHILHFKGGLKFFMKKY